MSDVRQFILDDMSVDVKDHQARDDISTLQNDVGAIQTDLTDNVHPDITTIQTDLTDNVHPDITALQARTLKATILNTQSSGSNDITSLEYTIPDKYAVITIRLFSGGISDFITLPVLTMGNHLKVILNNGSQIFSVMISISSSRVLKVELYSASTVTGWSGSSVYGYSVE